MVIAATSVSSEDTPLVLHGVTHGDLAGVIGPDGAHFAGVRVWPIVEGAIAALVSELTWMPRWKFALRRGAQKAVDLTPILPALSALFPFVPVEPGTSFGGEATLRCMLAGRGAELDEIVLRHSAFLQCDVRAEFDPFEAELDAVSHSPVGALRAESDLEFELVRNALAQSVAGRQATFIARLRRSLTEVAADMMIPALPQSNGGFFRRVLLARSARKAFRDRLKTLAGEVGTGAHLRIGRFMPPLNFRRLEVRGADLSQICEARDALGLDESADRNAIRVAYRRTVERVAPVIGSERRDRLARLGAQFGLLDLVAEGQIRAARGAPDMSVRFDAKSLAETWLLKLHVHDVADRVA
jgi:hypothetical protein